MKPPTTGPEVAAILAELGLTQEGGAKLLGVEGRSMRRWIAGEREVSPPAARLLWAMRRNPGLVQALRDLP